MPRRSSHQPTTVDQLTDSCRYCTGHGRASLPLRPEFTELVSEGLRADYWCPRCRSAWTTTWDCEDFAKVLLDQLIGTLAELFATEPDEGRAA